MGDNAQRTLETEDSAVQDFLCVPSNPPSRLFPPLPWQLKLCHSSAAVRVAPLAAAGGALGGAAHALPAAFANCGVHMFAYLSADRRQPCVCVAFLFYAQAVDSSVCTGDGSRGIAFRA